MEMLSPSHFSAQYIDFEAPLYEGDYVNGAVVPFSWEKKPGVPLMMSPNHVENNKEKEACELCTHRVERVMLSPNTSDNTKEKEVCVQNSLQICSTHALFPLPKPPSAGLQTSSPSNTNTTPINNVSNISTTFSPSSSSAKPHTHKQRRSLQAYLINKQAKNITIVMNKANIMKDDPFLKALEACSEHSIIMEGQTHERKVQENSTREAKEGELGDMDASNHGVHKISSKALLSKLFEEKVSCKSKQFDDEVLNCKTSLSKLHGALDDKVLYTKPQLSKLHGAFDDNVLNANPQLRKLNYEDDAHYAKSPLNSFIGDIDDKVLNANPQLSKLNYEAAAIDDKVFNNKSPLNNKQVLNANTQLSKLNYAGECDNKLHRSPIRRGFDDKEACRTPLRKLVVKGSEACGKPASYNGHPAFMVASFHQSPKQKKPITPKPEPITPKPAQTRPLHQRSSSYGGYGCLGCTNADHYDSIVRL